MDRSCTIYYYSQILFPENKFGEATEVLPQAFGSLARNKVIFNIVVYITVLTEVCVRFVHFVEISISGEIILNWKYCNLVLLVILKGML